MKKAAALAVVGGDLRHAYLARLLRADGHEVSIFALERQACAPDVSIIHDPKVGFAQAQAIILPMPMLQDEKHLNAPLSNAPHLIETIFDNIPSGKLVLGGAVPPQARERAAICHLLLHDYLTREELAVANAVPTALAISPHRHCAPHFLLLCKRLELLHLVKQLRYAVPRFLRQAGVLPDHLLNLLTRSPDLPHRFALARGRLHDFACQRIGCARFFHSGKHLPAGLRGNLLACPHDFNGMMNHFCGLARGKRQGAKDEQHSEDHRESNDQAYDLYELFLHLSP